MTDNGADLWLWVDPRRETGHDPGTLDLAGFLGRAVALFQTKPQWGGQRPNAVKANAGQAENGLEPVGAVLGLRVISDPTVAAGTYWLGLDDKSPTKREVLSETVQRIHSLGAGGASPRGDGRDAGAGCQFCQ
jgi:hypothetical protein